MFASKNKKIDLTWIDLKLFSELNKELLAGNRLLILLAQIDTWLRMYPEHEIELELFKNDINVVIKRLVEAYNKLTDSEKSKVAEVSNEKALEELEEKLTIDYFAKKVEKELKEKEKRTGKKQDLSAGNLQIQAAFKYAMENAAVPSNASVEQLREFEQAESRSAVVTGKVLELANAELTGIEKKYAHLKNLFAQKGGEDKRELMAEQIKIQQGESLYRDFLGLVKNIENIQEASKKIKGKSLLGNQKISAKAGVLINEVNQIVQQVKKIHDDPKKDPIILERIITNAILIILELLAKELKRINNEMNSYKLRAFIQDLNLHQDKNHYTRLVLLLFKDACQFFQPIIHDPRFVQQQYVKPGALDLDYARELVEDLRFPDKLNAERQVAYNLVLSQKDQPAQSLPKPLLG